MVRDEDSYFLQLLNSSSSCAQLLEMDKLYPQTYMCYHVRGAGERAAVLPEARLHARLRLDHLHVAPQRVRDALGEVHEGDRAQWCTLACRTSGMRTRRASARRTPAA